MATDQQIKGRQLEEEKRANMEKERENRRSNREHERLKGQENRIKDKDVRVKSGKVALDALGKLLPSAKDGVEILKLFGMSNHPSWYNSDPGAVNDACSVSFLTPLGRNTDFGSVGTNGTTIQKFTSAVPGILGLGFTPCPGYTKGSGTTAMEVAAKNIYAYVRYNNSGAKNYEPSDLMLYLLAMDSIYTMYAFMCRIYACAIKYSKENWYEGKELIRNLGINPESVIQNLAQIRAWLRVQAANLNAFNVPKNMPYYHRHIWMALNVFKDQNTRRSQLYQFIPHNLYFYDDENGRLVPRQILDLESSTVTFVDFSAMQKHFTDMYNYLIVSTDVGTMSGDILKAYGSGNLIVTQAPTEDFVVEPIYDEHVLYQIHNATICGSVTNLYIGQDANGYLRIGLPDDTNPHIITGTPYLKQYDFILNNSPSIYYYTYRDRAVVDIGFDDPKPIDVMVASRLCVTMGSDSGIPCLTEVGSEFITRCRLSRGTDSSAVVTSTSFITISTSSVSFTEFITKFDWAPLFTILYVTGSGSSTAVSSAKLAGDIANFAIVDSETLANMHLVAITSEFDINDLNRKVK